MWWPVSDFNYVNSPLQVVTVSCPRPGTFCKVSFPENSPPFSVPFTLNYLLIFDTCCDQKAPSAASALLLLLRCVNVMK